jgi:hypothetical protein
MRGMRGMRVLVDRVILAQPTPPKRPPSPSQGEGRGEVQSWATDLLPHNDDRGLHCSFPRLPILAHTA